MDFRLNKKSEFPIYQQLKEQIKYFILSGALQPRTRVPPPRELALYLQINRNTVIAAYKELEQEGLLTTRQGQGTYISEKLSPLPDKERKEALFDLVQRALAETIKLGFTVDDFFTIVFNETILRGKSHMKQELNALLVECNEPELHYYSAELQKHLGIKISTCLLSDLQNKIHMECVINADFVITTFIHIEDVKAILEPLEKEVIAIMAGPHLQSLMRVGQLPPKTRVGIVCAGEGAYRLRKSLETAGINHVKLEHCGIDNKQELNELLRKVDCVISSRVVYDELKKIAPPDVEIMEFFNVLDQAGVEMLKQYVKNKKAGRSDQNAHLSTN